MSDLIWERLERKNKKCCIQELYCFFFLQDIISPFFPFLTLSLPECISYKTNVALVNDSRCFLQFLQAALMMMMMLKMMISAAARWLRFFLSAG